MDDDFEGTVGLEEKYIFQTYTRNPLLLVRGRGSRVWDSSGREYIDCVAGIAVNNTGHCHPRIVEAIQRQAEELIHVSNLYYTRPQALLARKLVELTRMERVFFCNSGAEAVEAALKLVKKMTGKTEFIAAEGSFHGRTLGALSVTHPYRYRKPFEPLFPVKFVPYNNPEALEEAVNRDTAGVILEPIQGEGGVNIPDAGYLKAVREICDDRGIPLILDEIQTGFGRTGRWFAKEHFGVEPDVLTLSKSLGGGLPMGAMLARGDLDFEKGDHASTFGGGPLVSVAALAALEVIEEERLVERSREKGELLKREITRLGKQVEVRGKGLMIGIETEKEDCSELVERARRLGVLLNCTSKRVLRLLPPLVITREEIKRVVEVLDEIL